MTEAEEAVDDAAARFYSVERLGLLERGGRWLLYACAVIFVLESAYDASQGPATLVGALLDWPGYVFVAFAVACSAAAVPLVGVRGAPLRIAAILLLYARVVSIGMLLGFLALFTVGMSGFD